MHRPALVLALASVLLSSAWAISCRWDVVGTARSLESNQCLRLSLKKCDCPSSIACPRKYYKVETLPSWASCSATITWCDWGNWNHDIRTVQGFSSSCERHSTRKRHCCVDDNGTKVPSMVLDSRYWTCPGQRRGGDTQTDIQAVSCPGYSTATMPLVFFTIVVVLLILTAVIVILRIFCRSKLTSCWQRTRSAMSPHGAPDASPPPVTIAVAPPRYEDAMAQMPAPPTYDEAVMAGGHLNEACENDASPEDDQGGATATPKSTDSPNPSEVAEDSSPGDGEGEGSAERADGNSHC